MNSNHDESTDIPCESPSHTLYDDPNLPLRFDRIVDPLINQDTLSGESNTNYEAELEEYLTTESAAAQEHSRDDITTTAPPCADYVHTR